MRKIKVTVFHKTVSERKNTYVPKVFNCRRYSVCFKANSNVSAKGFIPNSDVIFRINEQTKGLISTGDRIAIGEFETMPESAMTVRAVSENRFGSRLVSHTKVVCG